jgi:ABC-type sulfate/molybdate transport systems ATPase subunit
MTLVTRTNRCEHRRIGCDVQHYDLFCHLSVSNPDALAAYAKLWGNSAAHRRH